VKLLPSIAVSLLIGFALGSIPVVNQYLHWNLWFIIPVSGLLLGMGLGWTQFYGCYLLNQPVNGWRTVVLALAASLSLLAVDFGIYRSTSIPIHGDPILPDGDHRLTELVSFPQYMKWRLGSSSIKTRHGDNLIEIGAAGTTISYVVDLAGAFVAAGGMLLVAWSMYPYCARCSRFKSRAKRHVIAFHYDATRVQQILAEILEHIRTGACGVHATYLEDLYKRVHVRDGDTQLTADERYCGSCGEVTILCRFERQGKDGNWVDVPELAYTLTSPPNDLVSRDQDAPS
jgi:hypothetical protein